VTKTVGVGRASRRVLDDVRLTVGAGEVVAVLGRSGSGKSTLLHLLGALDQPDAGEISLAGERLTGKRPRALARMRLRHIGFVFQTFQLIEELTGAENVLLPARLPGAGPGGERRGRLLIDELGLAGLASRRPHELSGGEQQRFAIARALVNDPRAGARRRADRQPRPGQRRRRAGAASQPPRSGGGARHPRARGRRDRRSDPLSAVLGDHDILVAGELAPSAQTQRLAIGDQAVWQLPAGLILAPSALLTADQSPDGPPSSQLVNTFLAQALAGPKVTVPPDRSRRELAAPEMVEQLRRVSALRPAGGPVAATARLDYHADVGRSLRLIVLDLARRAGGSGGLASADQPAWLEHELAGAGARWVIVISHQPLASSEGGDLLLSLLDRDTRVIAAIAGHTHRNSIEPRATAAGGYWLIETASLIDYPQQARGLRVVATSGGGVALQSWMLDHTYSGDLGEISRQLAYLDAQGGRPEGFAGSRLDRNVTLYRGPRGPS